MISSAPAECALGEKFELFGLDRAPQTVNGERKLAVTRSIDAGETLTLDTCYGKKSVVNASGGSELGNLDKRCAFFILPPGENELTWYCSSSSPPDVSVRIVPQYIFA